MWEWSDGRAGRSNMSLRLTEVDRVRAPNRDPSLNPLSLIPLSPPLNETCGAAMNPLNPDPGRLSNSYIHSGKTCIDTV